MKRKYVVLLAIMAVTCWAAVASADTFNLVGAGATTGNIATSANTTANFTLLASNQLQIVINYTGTSVTEPTLLTALFWTSSTFATQVPPVTGAFGSASGPTASQTGTVFSTTGVTNVSGFWAYGTGPTTLGNQGVLAAGLGYNFTPLNNGPNNLIDGPGYSIIPGGVTGLTGNLINHQPYMYGTVTVLLNLPAGTLTNGITITNPQVYFGTANVPKVPIPPTALLMGTGLLGIIGLGWRRRK